MNEESKALIQEAMRVNDHSTITQMVQAADDPSRFAWQILDLAVDAKDEPLVDALLPHLDGVSQSYPIIRAVQRGTASIVKKLISLTEPDLDNSEALIRAASLGRVAMVEALLPHSDALSNESEALLRAARNGHVAAVLALIPHSDPKAQDSRALQAACSKGHVEVVRALLPVSSQIQCALGAFPSAASQGQLEVIELLIDSNLPDAVDTYCAGLDSAVRGGHLAVVQRLLEAIIPLERPRQFGRTALNEAAGSGRLDMVKALLAVTDESAAPERALVNALEHGHDKVVEALLGHVTAEEARSNIHGGELLAKFEAIVARQAAAAQRADLDDVTELVVPFAFEPAVEIKAAKLRL
ncbi:ankyrin repeat domain-containing protein [Pseudoxanthomonas winnipegensis]|uniref:ankyrin repeat domain-containing protein n=1 Tax=Pseudoxanthomonas winnipegensis TaxID=2480810 RepID=UPI0030F441CA